MNKEITLRCIICGMLKPVETLTTEYDRAAKGENVVFTCTDCDAKIQMGVK